MGYMELVLTAFALSMDAFAVAICKGLSLGKKSFKHALMTGLFFGGFQALMPLLGFLLAVKFKDYITAIDHWVAFVLLAGIGIHMIKETNDSCDIPTADFSIKEMLLMSVATSIDALAVGVTFAFLGVSIFPAISTIGSITFILAFAGVSIGNIFGYKFKTKAQIAGGIILILMGVKILLEHLFFQ